ncbi:pyridoxamine 5'-phosphate oxidase family protein [uncultured Dokdonia sp.]|uniref:pyridoxamine 5'-phosphate oxidase family protein n=1 Tax=uncultured Dokdonia sp. TaxID=575653 RepID=UPI00260E9552|nr:pyridoxamine 5'-phosphate oxidase family protein [uncultured Dokdonia sp.]
MLDQYFDEVKKEFSLGINKKGHPFRYITLGTVDAGGVPQLRTVVLRQVQDDLSLRIYTDSRSSKIAQLLQNPTASLLFYHPKKLLQVKVTATASVITDPTELAKYYTGVQPNSKKDYTTAQPPGATLSNPDEVSYLEATHFFTIITFAPTQIEYLQLKRPNHIRASFTKTNDEWEGRFINP